MNTKKLLRNLAVVLLVLAGLFIYFRLQAAPLVQDDLPPVVENLPSDNSSTDISQNEPDLPPVIEEVLIDENESYTSKEDVALYIDTYHHLPPNFITKNDAKKLGWVAEEGNLWKVTDHMSIGGDKFGNYEGTLPEKKGRKYYECDIDYTGGKRNAKRIVFSSDGLVYYTEDHYEHFELLYGNPEE